MWLSFGFAQIVEINRSIYFYLYFSKPGKLLRTLFLQILLCSILVLLPFMIFNIRSFLSFLHRSLRLCSIFPQCLLSLLFRPDKFTSSVLCHLNSTTEHIQQVSKFLLVYFFTIYIWFVYDTPSIFSSLSRFFFPICLKIIYGCVLKHFYDGRFKLPLR